MTTQMFTAASATGKGLSRLDGRAKVTGAARYAAEFDQPGLVHAVIVSATVGLGRVIAMETAAVEAMPGVLAVITHRNAPRLAYKEHKGFIDPGHGERLHVLQNDEVRFFGQPVAVVVAETLDQAERAALALRIAYSSSRPVTAMDAVPVIEPEGPGSGVKARGDADAALAAAPVKIDQTYVIARENHNPMEPHATIAAWTGDKLSLWSKSQYVVNERAEIAAVFDLPEENVQVTCPFIGGAFGTSLRTWPHVTLAAIAARHVGKPVKLALGRKQMFYTTGHRPRTVQRLALGASADGLLTAIVHEGTGETSRYENFEEALTTVATYMYSCPNVRTQYRLAPLDSSTPTFMRGPGEASGIVALECAMDELAYTLGVDPIALRVRHEPAKDEGEDKPFSSRSILACYEQGAAKFGWAQRNPQPRSMRDGRLLIGQGMASATYPVFYAPANARVRLLPDGTAEIEAAASDMGPGTYTSIVQVAADVLGLAPEKIRFALGRSDFPVTPPHGGSMTMASVGSAVLAACQAVMDKAKASNQRPLEAEGSSARNSDARRKYSMHAFGAVFAEVSVDPDLGIVRVRRALGAYAAGRIVNPKLAHSQCIGGMVGGIGMALMEATAIDPRDGRIVNAQMADYLVPVNLDIGSLEAIFVPEEDPHVNPLGVKGLGEIALVGMAPAIANAVFHATGKRLHELPIRIEALL